MTYSWIVELVLHGEGTIVALWSSDKRVGLTNVGTIPEQHEPSHFFHSSFRRTLISSGSLHNELYLVLQQRCRGISHSHPQSPEGLWSNNFFRFKESPPLVCDLCILKWHPSMAPITPSMPHFVQKAAEVAVFSQMVNQLMNDGTMVHKVLSTSTIHLCADECDTLNLSDISQKRKW